MERYGGKIIDKKNSPQEFWKDVGRVLGRKRKMDAERMKNENGVDLNSREEIERAFRRRLERTFRISEEENLEFDGENERVVEDWIRQKGDELKRKNRIIYKDTPEIKPELLTDILNGFKEKSPGPSGITRKFLLNSHKNLLKMYAEVYTACLSRDWVLPEEI